LQAGDPFFQLVPDLGSNFSSVNNFRCHVVTPFLLVSLLE
jgi:hypothetical protein